MILSFVVNVVNGFSPSSISSCLNAVSITVLEDLVKPAMEYFDKTMTTKTEARLAKLLGGALMLNSAKSYTIRATDFFTHFMNYMYIYNFFTGIFSGVLVIAFAFLCTILGSTVLQVQ